MIKITVRTDILNGLIETSEKLGLDLEYVVNCGLESVLRCHEDLIQDLIERDKKLSGCLPG